MNELYLYLFWLFHIVCGALCDGKMWNKKEDDPKWTAQWISVYWLGWVAVIPFLTAYLVQIGVPILSWQSFAVASGMSVVWDLIYCKHESGVWVRDLPRWLTIPNPFKKEGRYEDRTIIIGFDRKHLIIFNWQRVIILILSIFL